jgi:glycosyltransferase involved in cell wall biosynthesis
MLGLHRGIGTWERRVNRFIALNAFCRDKFIAGGLPADRIRIKPNFVDQPASSDGPRRGLLFVGRLSPEKGLKVLAEASRQARVPVVLLGTGPLQAELATAESLRLLGARPMPEVLAQMRSAAALLIPSLCYENFPRTLVEAFACGLPVIASRLGSLADLVEEGRTGWLFEAGSAPALAAKLRQAVEQPDALAAMGRSARSVYEARYTAARNHEQLRAIYEEAITEGPRHD